MKFCNNPNIGIGISGAIVAIVLAKPDILILQHVTGYQITCRGRNNNAAAITDTLLL